MDRDEVEVHKLAKKERGQYAAILTEQTWSIKDLLYGFRRNFACGIQRVVPSGQDGSILPAQRRHVSILPASAPSRFASLSERHSGNIKQNKLQTGLFQPLKVSLSFTVIKLLNTNLELSTEKLK